MDSENKIYEIDLRALIAGNLNCKRHDVSPYILATSNDINLKCRPFESGRIWSRIEQTSYIESIFLKCGLQPIIRFVSDDYITIVDGYNRYLSIKNFCENKLVLDIKGLKQLKFLANKTFKDLTEEETTYFFKCDPITVLDYSYYNRNTHIELREEEEYEIIRYLHLVYNTGLRLEIEEIQKAQFYDDFITKKIRDKINEDSEFVDILLLMGLFNGRKKKNKIDNILLNCRLLIASTYSNMNNFCSTYNIETRIEDNYLPNLKDKDLEKVYRDFLLNVNQIYNNMICKQKWNNYPLLHVKPFLEATYWLISVIRKDNLGNPLQFDFMKYLDYFGGIEEQEKNFNPYQAHYKKNIYNKYYVVAKYYEKYYGFDMSSYFKDENLVSSFVPVINNVDDLYKNHFNFKSEEMKVRDWIAVLSTSRYNIKPFYQRDEIMNISASSKIIESLLLGIQIPYILACDVKNTNGLVTEIIDGQQRLLSVLGFMGSPFMDENGVLNYSNKNGYSLKELRILYEYNNFKIDSVNEKNILFKDLQNKILNSSIYIYRTSCGSSDNFNAVDHFVRLNKNNYTIKDNTYRMWSLIADRRIIEYEQNITQKYIGNLFPSMNSKRTPNMISLKLAYLFYYKNFDDINFNNYNNRRITTWLKEFNYEKEKWMYKDTDRIALIRKKYIKALDDVEEFYEKLIDFLKIKDKSIRDLLAIKGGSSIPLSNYYYLFCMLGDFSKSELMSNSDKVYEIINGFFVKIKDDMLNNDQIIDLLKFIVNQLSIFDSSKQIRIIDNKRNEFMDKLKATLNT